jgi:uncharacterized MAPEG superfamily protein
LTADNKSNRHANAGERQEVLKSSGFAARRRVTRERLREKRCAFVQLLRWRAATGDSAICSHLPNYCATHKS